jgi:hypothetical protein
MANDDWRLRIELPPSMAESIAERLGLVHPEANELARGLSGSRYAVTQDGETLFVYASTSTELESAKPVIERELAAAGASGATTLTEHWLANEERWDDDAPGPSDDEQVLAEGYAPWEVRIPCPDHRAARELADRLDAEGYGVVRRWRYVIAGCASEEDANALAQRLHGQAGPGGEIVWEAMEERPFSVVNPM